MIDLRVELRDLTPLIWRELRVAPGLRLDDLHQAIQIVMGWQDRHLYVFEIGADEYGPKPDLPDEDEEEDIDPAWAGEASAVTVAQALSRGAGAFHYCYDFGDEWRVMVTAAGDGAVPGSPAGVDRVAAAGASEDAASAVPVCCVAGARAGPPEDIGGAGAYQDIVDGWTAERAAGQASPTLPRGFDPAAFDLAAVNRRLRAAFRQRATVDRPAGPEASADQQLLAELSLAVLWLGSRSAKQGLREASKAMRFEVLETLQDAGLIYTDPKWKSVRLTKAGIARARSIVGRLAPEPR
ncbi:MAG: DUF6429 family protein [Acidobacteriota bacterium]